MRVSALVAALAVVTTFAPACAGTRVVTSYYRSRGPHIAASRTLPFGTRLSLYNPRTHKRAWVVIHDRGPFVRGRSLDVPVGIARALGFSHRGVATLIVERH